MKHFFKNNTGLFSKSRFLLSALALAAATASFIGSGFGLPEQGKAASGYTLRVNVKTPSAGGQIMVALFNSEKGFPNGSNSLSGTKAPAKGTSTTLSFSGLKPGTYALAVFQDKNNNGKLDMNIVGIPTEPYGFSRNARSSFGPPSFGDAAIKLTKNTTISVNLK